MDLKLIPQTPEEMAAESARSGKYVRWRMDHGYRRAALGEIKCELCRHFLRYSNGRAVFFKCALQGDSSCASSDIRARNTCSMAEAREECPR